MALNLRQVQDMGRRLAENQASPLAADMRLLLKIVKAGLTESDRTDMCNRAIDDLVRDESDAFSVPRRRRFG